MTWMGGRKRRWRIVRELDGILKGFLSTKLLRIYINLDLHILTIIFNFYSTFSVSLFYSSRRAGCIIFQEVSRFKTKGEAGHGHAQSSHISWHQAVFVWWSLLHPIGQNLITKILLAGNMFNEYGFYSAWHHGCNMSNMSCSIAGRSHLPIAPYLNGPPKNLSTRLALQILCLWLLFWCRTVPPPPHPPLHHTVSSSLSLDNFLELTCINLPWASSRLDFITEN